MGELIGLWVVYSGKGPGRATWISHIVFQAVLVVALVDFSVVIFLVDHSRAWSLNERERLELLKGWCFHSVFGFYLLLLALAYVFYYYKARSVNGYAYKPGEQRSD